MADISKKVVRMCERFEEEVQKVVAEEVAEALAEGGSGEIEKLKEEKYSLYAKWQERGEEIKRLTQETRDRCSEVNYLGEVIKKLKKENKEYEAESLNSQIKEKRLYEEGFGLQKQVEHDLFRWEELSESLVGERDAVRWAEVEELVGKLKEENEDLRRQVKSGECDSFGTVWEVEKED
tara:strand:- start:870 stop:1406 length:537 start_codon:yes stop_codon:yes gene_type:complete